MKAWRVGDADSGCVLVRCESRGRAKTMHPDYHRHDRDVFLWMRAVRAPWLDGDGPARELHWVDKPCDHPNVTEWGDCPDCFEGSILDRDATIAANR